MMASARNITRLLELQSSTIEKIENIKGTGPGGLPNGERWISSHDVFHYLYKNPKCIMYVTYLSRLRYWCIPGKDKKY